MSALPNVDEFILGKLKIVLDMGDMIDVALRSVPRIFGR